MRFGCGSDVVRMWFGCGSDVVRMWLGRVCGSGADNLAGVKGKWFPATTCKVRDSPLDCGCQGREDPSSHKK